MVSDLLSSKSAAYLIDSLCLLWFDFLSFVIILCCMIFGFFLGLLACDLG